MDGDRNRNRIATPANHAQGVKLWGDLWARVEAAEAEIRHLQRKNDRLEADIAALRQRSRLRAVSG